MGSNMAEAHPVGFRWPMKAKERGATLIHVDPRFSRTSALCDVFVGIRAGSDVAFLGGLVNYVLAHDRWFREYVLAYTNVSVIIDEGFRDTEDLAGLFSGYHPETVSYDPRAGSGRAASCTRSAGPSTRPGCRSSAPPASCNCCSGTSAGPAAASWRCAATPAFRGAPTSPPSMTCFPATCRSRSPTPTTTR